MSLTIGSDHEYWWQHPDKPCLDDPDGWIDPPKRGRKKAVARMVAACNECPVLRECRTDLLASSKTWQHYGIQAGIVGRFW